MASGFYGHGSNNLPDERTPSTPKVHGISVYTNDEKRWVTKLKSTSTMRCHCEFNREIHEEDQAHRV
jgi:hypothetical protein